MKPLIAFLTLLVSQVAAIDCPTSCMCINDTPGLSVSCVEGTQREIPQEMSPSLVTLEVAGSAILELNFDSFSSYPLLQRLDVSSSGVRKVSVSTFSILNDLRSVDLAYNEITRLAPETFKDNSKLEELYLQGNPLIFVSDRPILSSNSLTLLMINSCQLEELGPDAFEGLTKIEELHVEGNGEVKGLNIKTFFPLENLKEIYIDFFPDTKKSALSDETIEFLQASGVKVTHVEAEVVEIDDEDLRFWNLLPNNSVSKETIDDIDRTLQIVIFIGVMFIVFLVSFICLYLIAVFVRRSWARRRGNNGFSYERIRPAAGACNFIEVKLEDNPPTYTSLDIKEKLRGNNNASTSLPCSVNLPPVHGSSCPPVERRL